MKLLTITMIALTMLLLPFFNDKLSAQVKVDGKIENNEYQSVYEVAKELKIFVTSKDDQVFIGLESKSKGWPAIGFGSPKMDGSIMFLFTYEKDKPVVKELIGVGHGHKERNNKYVKQFSVKKEGNKTSVEFIIPNKVENVNLKGDVDTIWAVSENYSLQTYHSKRGKIKIKF